jgi:hypothetical protein
MVKTNKKHFVVTTSKFSKNGLPVFNTARLTLRQKRFVSKSIKSFIYNPDMLDSTANYAYISYFTDEDFDGGMLRATDVVIKEFEDTITAAFNKAEAA